MTAKHPPGIGSPADFVSALEAQAQDAAVDSVISMLTQPTGRTPRSQDVELSRWYRGLDAQSQSFVRRVAESSAQACLFGVLCIFDGVRPIDDGPAKGQVEASFVRRDTRIALTPSTGELLHDLMRT